MSHSETVTTRTTTTSEPAPSRLKLWVIGFVLLFAAGGAYWYWGAGQADGARQQGPGGPGRGRFGQGNMAVPVRVVPVRTDTVNVQIRALGTVTPLNTVTVRSRLDGELVRVLFTEGQRVSAGQLLAEIDPRPYQTALNQAQGQLEENQARLKNAQGDLARYQKLAAEGLITSQQVTTQEALVQQYQGALQANEAQVNNARLQLSYTRVVAPIDGRLGLRQVDAGNLIRGGDANGLVVITQMRPISVLFTVPEAELQAVLDSLREGRRLPVEAWDRSDKELLARGTLKTMDNQIDTTTGTIKLRAEFANDDEKLFPNQFVNVRLGVRTLPNAVVIPSAAVQRASFGTFVYVVQPDSKVTIRRIELGPTEGEQVAITSGVTANERVVLEGVDELKEGSRVEIIPEGGQQPGRRTGAGGNRSGAQGGPGVGAPGAGGSDQGAPGSGGRGPGGTGQGAGGQRQGGQRQ